MDKLQVDSLNLMKISGTSDKKNGHRVFSWQNSVNSTYKIVWRQKGVVNSNNDIFVVIMHNCCNGFNIRNSEERVRHGFEPYQLCIWFEGICNVFWLSYIDHVEFNSVPGCTFVEITVGTSVKIITNDGVVSILNFLY